MNTTMIATNIKFIGVPALIAAAMLAFGQEQGSKRSNDPVGSEFEAEAERLDLELLATGAASVEAGESLEARAERFAAWAGANRERLESHASQGRKLGIGKGALSALHSEAVSLEELCEKTGLWAASDEGRVILAEMEEGTKAEFAAGVAEPAPFDPVGAAVAAALAGLEGASPEERCAAIAAASESIQAAISAANEGGDAEAESGE